MEMATASEKCNSAQIDMTSHTKGLRIFNSGVSSLCRLQEKINFLPYILRLSSKKNFHAPLFVGSRYFLIQDALRERMYINHPQTTLLIIPYNMLSFNLVAFIVPKELKKKFVERLQCVCISRERSQNKNEFCSVVKTSRSG